MDEVGGHRKRRVFHWSDEARNLIRTLFGSSQNGHNHSNRDRPVLGPIWNQPPPHQTEGALGLLVVLPHNGDLLSKRNIPTMLPAHVVVKIEMVPDATRVGG